jgi:hypothetical protein
MFITSIQRSSTAPTSSPPSLISLDRKQRGKNPTAKVSGYGNLISLDHGNENIVKQQNM